MRRGGTQRAHVRARDAVVPHGAHHLGALDGAVDAQVQQGALADALGVTGEAPLQRAPLALDDAVGERVHLQALGDVPRGRHKLRWKALLVEHHEHVVIVGGVQPLQEAELLWAVQFGAVSGELEAADALVRVGDDASVRSRAPLKVGVRQSLQVRHQLQHWQTARKGCVQLRPEHVAQHVHRLAEKLHLLPCLVQHVVHTGAEGHHSVAEVLHHPQLDDVPHADHAPVHPLEVLHQHASEHLVEGPPVRKGDGLRAVLVQTKQCALQAAHEGLHASV